jgi:hypothetical protein
MYLSPIRQIDAKRKEKNVKKENKKFWKLKCKRTYSAAAPAWKKYANISKNSDKLLI